MMLAFRRVLLASHVAIDSDSCRLWAISQLGRLRKEFFFLLGLVLLLAGCGPTTQEAFVRNLESQPAKHSELATLPFQPFHIGDHQEFIADDLEIGQFAWGKSHFLALRLPESTEPYYVVVKSFMVSPSKSFRYGMVRGGDIKDPWVFFPYVVLLDKDMNIIQRSRINDFQVNSNMRYLPLQGFTGRSWLQGAFRINPLARAKPHYLVISTRPGAVGKIGVIPTRFWPFDAFAVWPTGVPSLEPRESSSEVQGVALHYGNIGELQIQAMYPSDLLRTALGKKTARYKKLPEAVPGKLYQVKGLRVRAPDASGYLVEDRSSHHDANLMFLKDLPSGRGNVTMFAQLYQPGQMFVDNLQLLAEFAIPELQALFAELNYKVVDVPLLDTTCRRINFTGKGRAVFLAPVRGYDIHCLVSGPGGQIRAVRIGGNYTVNPEYSLPDRLPEDMKGFVNGVSFDVSSMR